MTNALFSFSDGVVLEFRLDISSSWRKNALSCLEFNDPM